MYRNILRIALVLLVAAPFSAHAATLSFQSGTSYAVGDTFTAFVAVGTTPSVPINAVSANVSYPADALEFLSFSKAGSIITLWSQEPTFSYGAAHLEGVIFNPGYNGPSGRVLGLTFRVKKTGTATLSLSNASVLANDGNGTDVLTGTSPVTIALTEAVPKPKTEPKPVQPVSEPQQPKVAEPTTTPQTITQVVVVNSPYQLLTALVLLLCILLVGLIPYVLYRMHTRYALKASMREARKNIRKDFDIIEGELRMINAKESEVGELKKQFAQTEKDVDKALKEIDKKLK